MLRLYQQGEMNDVGYMADFDIVVYINWIFGRLRMRTRTQEINSTKNIIINCEVYNHEIHMMSNLV